MNQNLEVCLNQALLTLVASEYYQGNIAQFSGNMTAGSLLLHWQALAPPVVTLTGEAGQNVKIVFFPVKLTGQGISGSALLTVTVTSTLAITGGVLSLTSLNAGVTGDAGFITSLIAQQVNNMIAAQYASRVAAIPIPALQNLLNTQLSVQLENAVVVPGSCQVSGSLTYQGQGPADTAPPPLCVSAPTPAVGISLNGAGVYTVLLTQNSAFPKVLPVDSKHEHSEGILGHFGYGVQGSVQVALPTIRIMGNQASAATTIQFNLQGGIEGFGVWTWVPLPIPTAQVDLWVGLVIDSAKTRASVQVQGVNNIQFQQVNFPSVLASVAGAILQLIENIVRGALPSLIVGQEFTVFTLPSTLPGTPFPASLSFGQLGFMNSGVGAVVNVQSQAAAQPRPMAAVRRATAGGNGNGNKFFVELAWAAMWQKTRQDGSVNPYYLPSMILNGVTSNNVHIGPLGTVTVDDIPTVELMQSKNLSPLPFKSGSVGIEFSGVTLWGIDTLANQGLEYTPDPNNPNSGTIVASMSAGPIQATGNYVVTASGLAMCALDTAGGLLSLPGAAAGAAPQGSTPQGATPPLDQMLDAARDQRTRLWQTPNGGNAMDKFYEHNEVYNQLYSITGSPLVVQWAVPATQQNATATYNATQQGGNVNDAQGVYNGNAFTQALNLHTTCIHAAKNAGNPPYTLDKADYQAAAEAVFAFEGTVNTTGNSATQTNPMTVDQVYQTVQNAPPSLAVPKQVVRTEAQAHHILRFRHELEKFDAAYTAALRGSDEVATIFQGPVQLVISQASLALTATIDFSGSVPVATVTALTATFPVPQIQVDVNAWRQGQYASIGEQLIPYFEQAGFLLNLAHDKLQNAIESSTVTSYLTTALNDALSKLLGPLPSGN